MTGVEADQVNVAAGVVFVSLKLAQQIVVGKLCHQSGVFLGRPGLRLTGSLCLLHVICQLFLGRWNINRHQRWFNGLFPAASLQGKASGMAEANPGRTIRVDGFIHARTRFL